MIEPIESISVYDYNYNAIAEFNKKKYHHEINLQNLDESSAKQKMT